MQAMTKKVKIFIEGGKVLENAGLLGGLDCDEAL